MTLNTDLKDLINACKNSSWSNWIFSKFAFAFRLDNPLINVANWDVTFNGQYNLNSFCSHHWILGVLRINYHLDYDNTYDSNNKLSKSCDVYRRNGNLGTIILTSAIPDSKNLVIQPFNLADFGPVLKKARTKIPEFLENVYDRRRLLTWMDYLTLAQFEEKIMKQQPVEGSILIL